MFGYLGRVLTSWWHEGFHHSPQTPGDKPRSPCGRWLCAPQIPSSWHLLSPPRCTWGTDKNHSYYQQAEMKTEHWHHWHWPNHLLCCWTNLLTLVSLSALQLWKSSSPHCHPLSKHAQAFLRKYFIAHVRIDLQLARQWGMAKCFRKLNQIFWMGFFFWAQTERSCIWTHAKIQNINQEGKKKRKNIQKRLKSNILTGIYLPFHWYFYFSVYSSLLLTQLLYPVDAEGSGKFMCKLQVLFATGHTVHVWNNTSAVAQAREAN